MTKAMTAGPMTPLAGPQMIGPVAADYAIAVSAVDPYRLAEDVLVPLPTAAASHTVTAARTKEGT